MTIHCDAIAIVISKSTGKVTVFDKGQSSSEKYMSFFMYSPKFSHALH